MFTNACWSQGAERTLPHTRRTATDIGGAPNSGALPLRRLRHRQRRFGHAEGRRQQLAVVEMLVQHEVRFGSRVRCAFGRCSEKFAPRLRRLQKELVVADQSDDFAAHVEPVLTKHLLEGYGTHVAKLIADVLNIREVRCHGRFLGEGLTTQGSGVRGRRGSLSPAENMPGPASPAADC